MKLETTVVLVVVLTLVMIGTLAVYSVSAVSVAGKERILHQIAYVVLGLILMFSTSIGKECVGSPIRYSICIP